MKVPLIYGGCDCPISVYLWDKRKPSFKIFAWFLCDKRAPSAYAGLLEDCGCLGVEVTEESQELQQKEASQTRRLDDPCLRQDRCVAIH